MCTRRQVVAGASSALGWITWPATAARADDHATFVSAAKKMRDEAVAAGDQSFGAVLVKDGAIVGYGPSRVVVDRNVDPHAERVALWDAQRRLGTQDLSGTILYSTSRPCAACEMAAATFGVSRMRFGDGPTDAGPPRKR